MKIANRPSVRSVAGRVSSSTMGRMKTLMTERTTAMTIAVRTTLSPCTCHTTRKTASKARTLTMKRIKNIGHLRVVSADFEDLVFAVRRLVDLRIAALIVRYVRARLSQLLRTNHGIRDSVALEERLTVRSALVHGDDVALALVRVGQAPRPQPAGVAHDLGSPAHCQDGVVVLPAGEEQGVRGRMRLRPVGDGQLVVVQEAEADGGEILLGGAHKVEGAGERRDGKKSQAHHREPRPATDPLV